MSLVHGMLAGADSIDDMNVLRAGSTGLVLGHRVMAPSTLGTFLRAFTFGHVRQLDRVLDRRAGARVGGGRRARRRAVGDRHRQLHRRGPRRAEAGRRLRIHPQLGYHPILAVRADTGEVLHIRNRKGKANTQRGAARFIDELLARVASRRAHGQIVIRADTGFENHKLMRRARPPRDRVLDRRQAEQRRSGR